MRIHKKDKARGLRTKTKKGQRLPRVVCDKCGDKRIIFFVDTHGKERVWCHDCGHKILKKRIPKLMAKRGH